MVEQTLELRGIRLDHLIDYLKELQGHQESFELPYRFQGPVWRASIMKEVQTKITSRFMVNAVFIQFEAGNEEELHTIVAAFRRKTFRAGG